MGYPNRFKAQRVTGQTPISQAPGKVGELEQVYCDALGIPIDEDFDAKVVVSPSEKGIANGIASLGADAKVPAAQLPDLVGGFSGAFLYRGSDLSLVQYSNIVPWSTEKWDTDAFHEGVTHPERLTIPTGKAGYYLLVAHLTLTANGAAYQVRMESNASNSSYAIPILFSASGEFMAEVSWLQHLQVGDYVQLNVWASQAGDSLKAGEDKSWWGLALVGV